MISVCYLIVAVSLLCSFGKAETFSPTKSWATRFYQQKQLFTSLTSENQDEFLANVISSYWNMTYDEQLKKKQKCSKANVDMILTHSESWNTKKCKLQQIVPSPVTKAYRNKDEFTIWIGLDGNPKTVGIKIGKSSLGKAICFKTTKIITIKESHKMVAKVYQDFIRLSALPACFQLNDGGHWRSLIVRSNEAGDIIALVIVQPGGFTYRRMQEEHKAMAEYFFKRLPNISLFQQKCVYSRCTQKDSPFYLLYGKLYIIESLNGYKFKISPDTYFPINKMVAEVLNDYIIKTAKLKPNTTVFDVCSGTGISSIVVSKFVRKVFWFDDMKKVYKKAKENVKLNNIQNVDFQFGPIESNLKSVLGNLTALRDIVAIVNSASTRPGLYAIKAIRDSLQISRVVYISGKPDSPNSMTNFRALCSNTTSNFPPFILTKVIPFDVLPQTANVELMLLFER